KASENVLKPSEKQRILFPSKAPIRGRFHRATLAAVPESKHNLRRQLKQK
ncbi:hypothetical protein CpipJ_CPIJ001184, partial [Culex quinquefasciatus]